VAEVLAEGTISIKRQARIKHEANTRGFVAVPPFQHLDIIAGQATV
jgi:threonine dehydratase